MKITKIIVITVCSLMLSFCLFPLDSFAATNSEAVMEEAHSLCADCETGESIDDAMSLMSMRSSVPYCNHVDPTRELHSSMRYLRTVNYINHIYNRIDVRDWYICILCNYENFWVHGYLPL